jgi:hypothetical protein
MAALVVMGAIITGCTNDDNTIGEPQQPENNSNVVTMTTTVSLDGGAGTRALTSGGVKTFAEGEQIALVYKNTSDATVKVVSTALTDGDIASGGKSATFTFTLEDPDKTQAVTYIYPAAMANADGSVNYGALATQDGTLGTLSSSLDLCTYNSAWNEGSLPAATLENQLAILALTLKDADGTNTLTSTITGVTVSDGTYSYAVTREAAAGPIYVAILPTTSANIEVTATDGTTNYTKSLTGKTYAAGNGYNISLRMAAVTPYGLKAIDMGNGLKWANMNVGARKETDYGDYLAWGATKPFYVTHDANGNEITGQWVDGKTEYDYKNYPFMQSGQSDWEYITKYTFDDGQKEGIWYDGDTFKGDNGDGVEHKDFASYDYVDDAARANWGGKWRTPTDAEWTWLRENCTWAWKTTNDGYAHNGILVTSNVNGNQIYLPAAGYRSNDLLLDAGRGGLYWSSSLYESPDESFSDVASGVYFSSHEFVSFNGCRFYGQSVRPVTN